MNTELFIKVIQKIVKDETQKVVHDELQKLIPAIAQAMKAQLQTINNTGLKKEHPKNNKTISNKTLEQFLGTTSSNDATMTSILEQTKKELSPDDPILSGGTGEELDTIASSPMTPIAHQVQNNIVKDYSALMEAYNKKGLK